MAGNPAGSHRQGHRGSLALAAYSHVECVNEAKRGGSSDDREPKVGMTKPRDIYVPDLHIDTLKVKSRNFR